MTKNRWIAAVVAAAVAGFVLGFVSAVIFPDAKQQPEELPKIEGGWAEIKPIPAAPKALEFHEVKTHKANLDMDDVHEILFTEYKFPAVLQGFKEGDTIEATLAGELTIKGQKRKVEYKITVGLQKMTSNLKPGQKTSPRMSGTFESIQSFHGDKRKGTVEFGFGHADKCTVILFGSVTDNDEDSVGLVAGTWFADLVKKPDGAYVFENVMSNLSPDNK